MPGSPLLSAMLMVAAPVPPPVADAPFEGTAAVDPDFVLTREEKLEQWRRFRAGLVVSVVLSGLALGGGGALVGLNVWSARVTDDVDVGPLVGGSILAAAGVTGVIVGGAGLVRHRRRRAEIGFSPGGLSLRF